jgi:hypothetical protein
VEKDDLEQVAARSRKPCLIFVQQDLVLEVTIMTVLTLWIGDFGLGGPLFG